MLASVRLGSSQAKLKRDPYKVVVVVVVMMMNVVAAM